MAPVVSWPLAIIDFEASSLEHDSFPVEVGVAMLAAPGEPIRVWSTLIAPEDAWRQSGHWSRRSQALHGLDRDRLAAEGRSVRGVVAALQALLAPGLTIWCDGGDYDRYWLDRLLGAAGCEPFAVLEDVGNLVAALPPHQAGVFRAALARSRPRHRAGEDAAHLLLAIAEALALPVDAAVERIADPGSGPQTDQRFGMRPGAR